MKPRDNFEKFITDHKEEFNMEEPSGDLWAKIEAELPSTSSPKVIKVNWLKHARNAAAVLIISATSIFIYDLTQKNGSDAPQMADIEKEQINTPKLPAEVQEEMHYYTVKVNTTINEFNQLTKDNPAVNKDVLKDLEELDKDMQQLMIDLQENMDSEEVLEAIIQNYRYRLQVLEDIMSELKDEKNSEDEESIEI